MGSLVYIVSPDIPSNVPHCLLRELDCCVWFKRKQRDFVGDAMCEGREMIAVSFDDEDLGRRKKVIEASAIGCV